MRYHLGCLHEPNGCPHPRDLGDGESKNPSLKPERGVGVKARWMIDASGLSSWQV